ARRDTSLKLIAVPSYVNRRGCAPLAAYRPTRGAKRGLPARTRRTPAVRGAASIELVLRRQQRPVYRERREHALRGGGGGEVRPARDVAGGVDAGDRRLATRVDGELAGLGRPAAEP